MTLGVALYISRLEDEWLWGFGGLKSSDALPFRVFADALSLCVRRLGGFDLCIV